MTVVRVLSPTSSTGLWCLHATFKLAPYIRFSCRIPRRESGVKQLRQSARQWLCCMGAGDHDPLDSPNSRNLSAEAAVHVALECMEYFQQGNLDALLKYLPGSVIDRAIDLKRSKFRDVSVMQTQSEMQGGLEDAELSLMELLTVTPPSALSIDSFAYRSLIFNPPLDVCLLSTLLVSPTRCFQRFAVTTFSGEEVALLLDLQLEEALEPKYRSLRVVHQWFLRGITGEPASLQAPEISNLGPVPKIGPELVVLAQLDALQRRDIPRVFRFASPSNCQMYEYDVSKFTAMLESDPYAPLLGHSDSEILNSKQTTADRAYIVVGKHV